MQDPSPKRHCLSLSSPPASKPTSPQAATSLGRVSIVAKSPSFFMIEDTRKEFRLRVRAQSASECVVWQLGADSGGHCAALCKARCAGGHWCPMRHVGFQGEDASYELVATRPIKDYEHGARITECFGLAVQPEELIGKRVCTHAEWYAGIWKLSASPALCPTISTAVVARACLLSALSALAAVDSAVVLSTSVNFCNFGRWLWPPYFISHSISDPDTWRGAASSKITRKLSLV